MARDGIDYEATTRAWKVGRLIALFEREGLTVDTVAHWAIPDWEDAADRAGVNPPSAATRLQAVSVYSGMTAVPLRASTAKHTAPPRRSRQQTG